jgi:hypothetical protein
MSVNIYEAWNIPDPSESQIVPTNMSQRQISAKNAQVVERELANSAIRGEISADMMQEKTNQTTEFTMQLMTHLQTLYEELQLIRQEESRRCAVYLVVSGLLFAMLMMYIERLQRQVSNLNNMLHMHRFQTQPSLLQNSQLTGVSHLPMFS